MKLRIRDERDDSVQVWLEDDGNEITLMAEFPDKSEWALLSLRNGRYALHALDSSTGFDLDEAGYLKEEDDD